MVYHMPYKATTNWKFSQPHLLAKSRATFHTCLARPTHCVAKVTAYDMWVKKFPKPLYRRCRQPQLKNWKEINCKFLQFSICIENRIAGNHHPVPTRQGHVFWPHHKKRARTAAVLAGQRADLQCATHNPHAQRGARAVWLIFKKNIQWG